jgi:hypothetical protein
MTRAPEAVDKAVDAVRRAEHKLVEGATDVAAKTRKTRRKLARKAKATRKDLAKNAKKAKATAQQLTGTEKKRRRWPWILGLALAGAATAAVVRSKAAEPEPEQAFTPEPRTADEAPKAESRQQENGRPQPAKPATQPKK